KSDTMADDPSDEGSTPTAAELACAAAPAATALSNAKDAKDVRLVGQAVFFRQGTAVKRVLKDGTNAKDVYSSPNLVSSFVDPTVMVLVETTADSPNATIRVVPALTPEVNDEDEALPPEPAFPEFPAAEEGAPPGVAIATNF